MSRNQPKVEIKSRRESIGEWSSAIGFTVMASTALALVVDFFVLTPGLLTAPAAAYIGAIGTGVGLKVLGSVIPRMRFSRGTKVADTRPTNETEPEVELVERKYRPLMIRSERYRIG